MPLLMRSFAQEQPTFGVGMLTRVRVEFLMSRFNIILLGGSMIVFVNLLVDVLYGLIDPRIRYER